MKEFLVHINSVEFYLRNSSAMSTFRMLSLILLCGFTAIGSIAAEFVIPDATITGLTHAISHNFPAGPATTITDGAASGQFIQTNFTAMLTGSETVDWSFEAPTGKMFVVHTPPSGFSNVSLSVFCQWWGGSFDGMQYPVSTSFTFENLVGATPSHTYSYDIMGTGGKLIQFSDTFSIAPGTTFTGVKVSAQYNFSTVNSTQLQFNPQSFRFAASVTSPTQILGDGILMSLETLPILQMNINRSESGFDVSWPTNFNNWVLESATQLGSSNDWSTVTNICVIVGTNYVMTDMGIRPARYYRLKSQ